MMKPTYKQYADFLLFALDLGLCDTSNVIAWGDRLVEENARPEDWMIILSTIMGSPHFDAYQALRNVPGSRNLDISFRMLLYRLSQQCPTLHETTIAQTKAVQLIRGLYQFVHIEISDELKELLYTIDSDLDYWNYGNLQADRWPIIEQDYQNLLRLGIDFMI